MFLRRYSYCYRSGKLTHSTAVDYEASLAAETHRKHSRRLGCRLRPRQHPSGIVALPNGQQFFLVIDV
jgi:hypothetical protein